MKKCIATFSVLFLLLGCQPEPLETHEISAAPEIHKHLYKTTKEPISIDENTMEKFRDKFEIIQKQTNLDIENMTEKEINKATRYLGYFGEIGQAIQIYESALQQEAYQGRISFHHNLGRLYEEIDETSLAIRQYTYLVHIGHKNYQKDIDRILDRIQ